MIMFLLSKKIRRDIAQRRNKRNTSKYICLHHYPKLLMTAKNWATVYKVILESKVYLCDNGKSILNFREAYCIFFS